MIVKVTLAAKERDANTKQEAEKESLKELVNGCNETLHRLRNLEADNQPVNGLSERISFKSPSRETNHAHQEKQTTPI